MKFHIFAIVLIASFFALSLTAAAQVDPVIGQVTSSTFDSLAGGISGDGRFIVFESIGNLATENPQNADGNREIFLFDYAQRRIFQITNTKSLLTDPTLSSTFDNIKVDIVNVRPIISQNGRWIAFGSNATTSTPAMPNATNPANFDANAFTDAMGNNPLTTNGNTEMWLYQIPATAPADLSSGDEIAFTDLSQGTFTSLTNTPPSRLPVPATSTTQAIIADDNHDASINSNGMFVSFTSNRDLETAVGNASPNNNDEIFVYNRNSGVVKQITKTPRGSISAPIYNTNSTISGNGLRVAFSSNANNPIVDMTGGTNSDNNEEIFYADYDANGVFGTKKQLTATTRTNPGDIVNILSPGRRMSLDGRFIAFDSYADLASENGGTNQTGFATYLYDLNPPVQVPPLPVPNIRRIAARSDADSAAPGGDLARYPGFTDYDINGVPQTLVMETRMNIKPDGTIPTNADDGLNNDSSRPGQLYSFPLNVAAGSATFTRLTKLPAPFSFLTSTQALPSDSVRRMAFNLSLTEFGTGNIDLANEVYYFRLPNVTSQTPSNLSFATGASRQAVTASPVPTPSPTATPTPTPTPSPTPTATPTPTPQTPPAVQGLTSGMLAILNYDSGVNHPVVARTAVGSLDRRFTLPIELSGVTMTINGAACGLKFVSRRQIEFIVPPALGADDAGTSYPVVVNNNGTVIKGTVVLVPARPDIFTDLPVPGPGGRARVVNATNRVFTHEPFTITTFKLRGSRRVPSVLRVYLTGVSDLFLTSQNFSIKIGGVSNFPIVSNPILVEPGVYAVDFTLTPEIAGAGDQPIIITVMINGIIYQSRLDDTAPRLSIL